MMRRVLRKNILWTVVSRFGSQVLAVFSGLILARTLGSKGFGEFAFISAVVMIGNAASTFGTDMILIRRISADDDYSDLPTALVVQLMISFVFIAGTFVFYAFLPMASSLLVYIFALFPLAFFTISTIVLRGAQKMGSFSALHFLLALMQLVASIILFFEKGNVTRLAVYLLVAQVIAAFLGFAMCDTQIQGFYSHWKFSFQRIPPLLRSSSRIAVIGTLRLLYEKLATALLPFLSSVNTTGLFAASLRVMDAAKLGHMSALTAIYPEMARDKKFATHRTGFGLFLFSASILSLTIFLLADFIVNILFGVEFSSSILSLKIIVWSLPAYFVVTYYSLAFVARETEMPVMLSLLAGLLIMLALLEMLVPFYGLTGAATAILCAEIFQASLLWLQWRRYDFS